MLLGEFDGVDGFVLAHQYFEGEGLEWIFESSVGVVKRALDEVKRG